MLNKQEKIISLNKRFNSIDKNYLILMLLNNIKKQKIFESLDEFFIKEKIQKTLKLFLNRFLIKKDLLYNTIITLRWSLSNKKNIIILYFQSYKDLNIFLIIKNELLKFICNVFNNPYINIQLIIDNNFNINFLYKKNYYINYLKEKLYLINTEI